MNYPGIEKACFEITIDNGGLRRDRGEEQVKEETRAFLNQRPYQDKLPAIDAWLGSLDEETLSTVCAGEHEEMKAALSDSPEGTVRLLDEYFDEVC